MEQIIFNYLKNLGLPVVIVILIYFFCNKIFNSYWRDLWEKCKSIKWGAYKWEPKCELTNNSNFKNISNFPKDIKIDLKHYDLKLNTDTKDLELVSGENSFIQSLVTYIHMEKEQNLLTGVEYGNEFSHSIFIEKNYFEYCRQCQYLAKDLLNHEIFKEYIQQIYSICRKKDKLIIEMKVYGKANTLICVIPSYNKERKR